MSRTAQERNRAKEEAVPLSKASRQRRLLLGLLFGAALLYVVTLPWQRRMAAETERIDRETAAKQAAAARPVEAQNSLDTARAAVERAPGDAQAQLQLAQRYSEAGRLEEAVERAEIAVGLRPQDTEPLLALADIHQHARHYEAAMRAFKAALKITPDDPRPLVGLAYLYVSFGWPLEAESLLKPAAAVFPQNPQIKVTLALAYLQHENYVAAEKLLLEARSLVPNDASLWSPLAHVYNQAGRYEKAVTLARQALLKLPDNASIINELGKAYYHLNDLPQAEAAFRQALALHKEDVTARYYLALTLQRAEQIPQAVHELEYVLSRSPDYEQTRQILGKLYLRLNRAAEGQKLIEEAGRLQAQGQKHQHAGLLVSTKPNDSEAHWQMAQVYHEEKNENRALVELNKTLELKPDHADAQKLMAKLQSAGVQ